LSLALARRREAELELLHRDPCDATRLQLDQGPLARRIFQQNVMEILRGKPIQPLDRSLELTLPSGPR